MMRSIIALLAFASSACAFNAVPRALPSGLKLHGRRYAAPLVPIALLKEDSELPITRSRFECGVCGGSSDWCPVCRGPSLLEVSSPVEFNQFECGVCGGASDWCPVCRGPGSK